MAKTIHPSWLFAGPELDRKRKRIEILRQKITAENGGEEPELHRFYPYETPVSHIVDILQNGSLFASRRMVTLADAHALKDTDIEILTDYLKSPVSEAVLVLTTDLSPGSRDYPVKLAASLPRDAVEVFWEMFEKDKRGWVMHYFRENGLSADKAAVDLLLDITDGTTDGLRESCARLCFSREPGSSLTEKDVDIFLDHNKEETVYSLFDRFCRRDLSSVIDAYRAIIHADPSIADRLAMLLADQVSRLLDFKVLLSNGFDNEDAAANLKLKGGKRALRAYSVGAMKYSMPELQQAVRLLVELEAWQRTAPQELRIPRMELWFCRVTGMPEK